MTAPVLSRSNDAPTHWSGSLVLAGVFLPFIVSGARRLFDFIAAVGEMAHFGLPFPPLMAVLVALLRIGDSAW